MILFSLFLYILCALHIIECASSGLNCTKERCRLDKTTLKFFLLGDWGGLPVWPYKTRAQKKVGEAMNFLANSRESDFQMALGDNFYVTGVKNEFDHRFKATFEDVYKFYRLKNTPWYVLAGNHDHNGNETAQIAYTKRSCRWVFPKLFYTVRYQLADGTRVDIVMIDTVILCGQTKDGKFDGLFSYLFAAHPKRMKPANQKRAELRWQWIESQLAKSDAHYLFIAGHYPVYSVADFGPCPCLIDRLNPLMVKYNVTAYISGHDHNLQHLKVDSKGGTSLNYIISGAGAATDVSSAHLKDVPQKSLLFFYPKSNWFNVASNIGFTDGGFVLTELNEIRANFTYFTGKLKELYKFSLKPRF